MVDIKQGDCLELMKNIPDKSVDMILCDLPYGTTQCKWDTVIPFEPLWEQYKRIIKDNGAICLFSQQPFTTDLINSNRKMFRYEIIWEKTSPTNFLNAKKQPLRNHENIVVFYRKAPTYNPIKRIVPRNDIGRKRTNYSTKAQQYNEYRNESYKYTEDGTRYPLDVIKFSNWNGALFGKTENATKHPTQKPVDLCEYLIKTYTNDGETVLDNCMGSGSTGVACVNAGRNFIGIELDEHYFDVAKQRINQAIMRFDGALTTSERG